MVETENTKLKPRSWMDVPETDDEIKRQIAIAIQIERGKLIEPQEWTEYPDHTSEIESREGVDMPDVHTTKCSINNGYCKIFAERVYKRLGEPDEIEVKSDEDRHTWIEYDGVAYDAETACGVSHPSLLPVYNRK